MKLQRNIKLLELHSMLMNALFVVAVLVPYYRDEMGLTFQDFLIGEAAFAFVIIVLEVPSGWLSDVWERKHVLLLGTLFKVLGIVVLILADSLWMAILAQSIIGVAIGLISGTNTALLYDSLLELGRADEYSRLEGRRMAVSFYGVAVCAIAGSLLYGIHPELPNIATLFALAFAALAAILMVEPERIKKTVEQHPLKDMAETMHYALHGHSEVAMIIFFTAVLFSGTKVIMWFQQPYYMALHIPEALFGVLMACGWFMTGAASHMAHWYEDKMSNVSALSLSWGLAVISCLGAGLALGFHGIPFLLIGGSFIFGMANPRVTSAINKRVGSERRATILSTMNLLRSLFFIPLSFAVGWLVENKNINWGLNSLTAWLSLAGLCLGIWAYLKARKPQ